MYRLPKNKIETALLPYPPFFYVGNKKLRLGIALPEFWERSGIPPDITFGLVMNAARHQDDLLLAAARLL